jgi:hypothetical protein
MSFYCFNEDCNLWGESQRVVIHAVLPFPGCLNNSCRSCGGDLNYHDNWKYDDRHYDSGAPVVETKNNNYGIQRADNSDVLADRR